MSLPQFQPLAITGIGMVSAVGADADQTSASIRAGLSRFVSHPYYESETRDPGWDDTEPLTVASVPGLPPSLDLPARLQALSLAALSQIPGSAGTRRADLKSTALLVSLPWPDATVTRADLKKTLIPEILNRSGLSEFAAVEIRSGGHTGIFELLQDASGLIAAGKAQFCLALGVDSYLSVDRVELLDRAWRLKSERNVDGFVPGEAAAALMLESPDHAKKRSARIDGIITHLSFGSEPRTVSSENQSSGKGLTQALSEVLAAGSPPDSPFWMICDMNGESYRGFEWGLAITRLSRQLEPMKKLVHPADCVGDVGAATGGLLLASAVAGFRRGYAPANEAVLWAASDGGNRAALRVQRG